jgi:predicted GIY-YIG superfamily endonuclease
MLSSLKIYVLRLEDNKWYIGKTERDVDARYQEHCNGIGSAWTSRYKPIKIEEVKRNVSVFDEDKITKEYMAKYGIDNVRGGSYVQLELDDVQLYTIQTEIWAATDCCTTCGRRGHFASKCHARTDVNGREFTSEQECEIHEKTCRRKCQRCGRSNHNTNQCYATTYYDGDEISSDSDEDGDEISSDSDEDSYTD